ncbi:bifunctional diguanylate cyclase/phosphodiesterase [Catenovulum adriaticum]|uniref:EAL domain-containing protein n=1 Tax=Catenovulum adriaticum TaxID=2984846 RepID=A0ABY7AKY8_9ALTE|nr:EAL domain-containing protein [Catenovulum sp. TS8]WAJ69004.1 EAL domain-containing protein [Catenovulum sp. TS8]
MQLFLHLKHALFILLLGIGITYVSVNIVKKHETQEVKNTLSVEVNKLTEQIDSALNEQMFLYNWMAKQWLTFGQPDAYLWHQQAKLIIDNHNYLQAVVWVDKHKTIRWIEPLITNQPAFNLDLAKIPFINDVLEQAARTGEIAAVSNWKLVQGIDGLLIYAPIGAGEDIQGYISGVIKQKEFLNSIAQTTTLSGYQFSVLANDREIYHSHNQTSSGDEIAITRDIKVFNHNWQIKLWPTSKQLGIISSAYSTYTAWIGLLLSIIFAFVCQLLISARSYSRFLNKINQDLEYQISEREKVEQDLIKTANYDELTGLANRAAFDKHIKNKLTNKKPRQVAVMLVDLDRFKDVNDVLGHASGDRLLTKICTNIKAELNETHYLARVGGDEFGIYIDDVPSLVMLERTAMQILKALDTRFELDDYEFSTSASIGYTYADSQNHNLTDLIRNADSALNKAKDNGKNCIYRYNNQLHQSILNRVELARLLRQALDNKTFELHYQPKFDSESVSCIGFEALLRWRHPETNEFVRPDIFIPIAEETGLIIPLGKWILEQACAQLKQWHDMGYPELSMAINLSGRQIQASSLYQDIYQAYTRYELPSSAIEIELTEQVFIENIIQHENFMRKLTNSGVSLSIDDFGVGYSSLSYLKNFPVDTLKIDRSFIQELPQNYNDVCIVKAIIGLANSIDLKVIAEGVENKEQLTFLNQQGCKYIQGYYFSKPLTSEQITQKLTAEDDWFIKKQDFVF